MSPGTRRIPALQRVTLWLCFSGVLLSLPQEFGGSNQGLHVGFWLQKLTVQLPHPLSRITGAGEERKKIREMCLPPGKEETLDAAPGWEPKGWV